MTRELMVLSDLALCGSFAAGCWLAMRGQVVAAYAVMIGMEAVFLGILAYLSMVAR